MRARWMRTALAGLVGLALAVAGCGGGGSGTDTAESASPKPKASTETKITGPLTVFAAASLTEAFTTLGKDFEAAHPGVSVTFNFAGSSALATQINQGAPADVFASAAPKNMATVTDEGNAAGTPTTFVRNQLVIAVPAGNPHGIKTLADLAKPGVKVALCAEQVPCGAAAKTALAAGNIKLTPVTMEQDVKGALAKVTLGEVDAALVYRTDAKADDAKADDAEVDGIEFDESAAAINDYPVAVLKDAANPTAAKAFIAYVRSAKGMTVLTDAGFQAP